MARKIKSIKMMSFWKGTMMWEQEMNTDEYNFMLEAFKKFNVEDDQIQDFIEVLDDHESAYCLEYKTKGFYEFDGRDAVMDTFVINGLIKKGIIEDDNMNGLSIIFTYD